MAFGELGAHDFRARDSWYPWFWRIATHATHGFGENFGLRNTLNFIKKDPSISECSLPDTPGREAKISNLLGCHHC
ncbi:MAG: hypothetical protein LBF22_03980 [Deltaproteobacteria bacterium]|nr:hypothetical protein [Deltaproteobacteria bacterium]